MDFDSVSAQWKIAAEISNNMGNKTDFIDAVKSIKSAYQIEQNTSVHEKDKVFWQEHIDRANLAINTYLDLMIEAKKETLKKLKENGLDEFAEALETQDYSILSY